MASYALPASPGLASKEREPLLLGARIRTHQAGVEDRDRRPGCLRDLRKLPIARGLLGGVHSAGVTQANLGASWKAALYRTAGALSAAVLSAVLGFGAVRTGLALPVLAALCAYLTTNHPSFSAAGFTAALVLLLGTAVEAWHLAWLRVLYTVMGALIAFVVGVVLWPVRAREGLRTKLSQFLEDTGVLYQWVTEAALREACEGSEVERIRAKLGEDWVGITTPLEEARSEPSFSRFNDEAYISVIEEL